MMTGIIVYPYHCHHNLTDRELTSGINDASLMRSNLENSKTSTVYPGEYIPLWETEELLEKLKTSNNSPETPMVNMNELEDCFKVEVLLPGIKREDIFLYAHENILSIEVLHKKPRRINRSILQVKEFDGEYFERHIPLPETADTEFVSAEYKRGILSLHIPKTSDARRIATRAIVVY